MEDSMDLMDMLKESADYIRSRAGNDRIDVAIVLGSGLGDMADEIEDAIAIDYHDIPAGLRDIV